MAVAQTLHEIALDKAKKRPELVDFLTEEAPILKMLKWIPATHGLWNVEEILDSIQGASFTDLGAPLPSMKAETQLRQTYVNLLGGEVEVSKDKAAQNISPAVKMPFTNRRAWIRSWRSGVTTGARRRSRTS